MLPPLPRSALPLPFRSAALRLTSCVRGVHVERGGWRAMPAADGRRSRNPARLGQVRDGAARCTLWHSQGAAAAPRALWAMNAYRGSVGCPTGTNGGPARPTPCTAGWCSQAAAAAANPKGKAAPAAAKGAAAKGSAPVEEAPPPVVAPVVRAPVEEEEEPIEPIVVDSCQVRLRPRLLRTLALELSHTHAGAGDARPLLAPQTRAA